MTATPASTPNTETVTEEKTGYYPRYKVFIHNDDKTTFDFVITVLVKFFNKTPQEGAILALEVHETGVGFVGAYTLEQAEFRVDQVHSLARARKFPLTLTYEPE